MIDLYTWTTPNGRKVSVMLEECELEYTAKPVDLHKDEQFTDEFVAISPNSRIPAIVDHGVTRGPVVLMESGAILIYLADKTGRFLPTSEPYRSRTIQWLMWQMANIRPMIGQAGHFLMREEQVPYAVDRYVDETVRLLKILDNQLAVNEYMAGDYSIADMATYPWISAAREPLTGFRPEISELGHLAAWSERMAARPAVVAGMKVPEVEEAQ